MITRAKLTKGNRTFVAIQHGLFVRVETLTGDRTGEVWSTGKGGWFDGVPNQCAKWLERLGYSISELKYFN